MTQHRHGALRINDIDNDAGAAPDAEFCRVEDADFNAEPQRTGEKCAGEVIPDMFVIDQINPTLRCTVKDHQQLVLLNSVECGVSVHDVELYLREVDADSKKPVAKATAQHDYIEIYDGLAYWTEFTLESSQTSTATVIVDALYDAAGANAAPFDLQENVAYPTISGGHDLFTLGPVYLNNTQLGSVQRVTAANEYQFDSDVDQTRLTAYREARAVNDAVTRIRVRLKYRINWVPTTGVAHQGTALDSTNGIVFYARKKGYANTATEHVKWQAIDGTAFPINLQGSGSNLATDEFVVDVKKVTTPLVGTSNQAIP